ncbi:MAG: peptidyl-prolyl cis-trans isomerase [Syntrophales bacterium]|nr:peptidyl-prolyl cis-trans isomerase [Syntrophales bacterium]
MKSSGNLIGLLVLALILFFATPLWAHEDRVIAVVNSDIITLSEFNRALDPVIRSIDDPRARDDRRVMEEGRRFVLDRMIKELLMKQEAERLNIVVRDADVDAYIEDLLNRRNITRRHLLENLADENTSFEDFRENVRRDIMKSRLISREIRARVTVSNEEIGAYYKEHRNLYEGNEAVRIQQIFTVVPRGSDDAAREELRARAESIHALLEEGESFDSLVRNYSQGPEVRTGGDMGFVEKGMIHPAVEAAAFALEIEEVSGVIESPAGFHIIRVLDRRGAGLKPLEEVRQEILEAIGNKRMEERFQEWLGDLQAKAYIEIRL